MIGSIDAAYQRDVSSTFAGEIKERTCARNSVTSGRGETEASAVGVSGQAAVNGVDVGVVNQRTVTGEAGSCPPSCCRRLAEALTCRARHRGDTRYVFLARSTKRNTPTPPPIMTCPTCLPRSRLRDDRNGRSQPVVDALAVDRDRADCRIDGALFAAVMEATVHGVSTPRSEVTPQPIPITVSTTNRTSREAPVRVSNRTHVRPLVDSSWRRRASSP
jgi:hypothetical protein